MRLVTNLRPATIDDAHAIASLGMDFIGKLKLEAQPTLARVEVSVRALLNGSHGYGVVSEIDGVMTGFLLGVAVPVWFDMTNWSAIELAWWIDPKHRGGREAVEMVKVFEQWAQDMQVGRVVLSDVEFVDQAQPAGALIERLGYTLHERAFIKVI